MLEKNLKFKEIVRTIVIGQRPEAWFEIKGDDLGINFKY